MSTVPWSWHSPAENLFVGVESEGGMDKTVSYQDCVAGVFSSRPNDKITVIEHVSVELPKSLGNWLNPAYTTVTGGR